MPDKYDEVADHIVIPFGLPLEVAPSIAAYLRSAFPPPAEDARLTAALIYRLCGELAREAIRKRVDDKATIEDTYKEIINDLAVEISRFAESRVEPWREALRDATSEIECHEHNANCGLGIDDDLLSKLRTLLSNSPAKEDAK